ncbi:MAG: hypothetical protein H0V18_21175 [Pyrinomonadaceae bacterium]|nr:hypothetical protein [Pyrinomonadaceae bacterium]
MDCVPEGGSTQEENTLAGKSANALPSASVIRFAIRDLRFMALRAVSQSDHETQGWESKSYGLPRAGEGQSQGLALLKPVQSGSVFAFHEARVTFSNRGNADCSVGTEHMSVQQYSRVPN